MCGIIGYVGARKASEVLTEGLKRLEYRGYDSVGIAVANDKGMEIRKDKGMFEEVSTSLQFTDVEGHIGLGHSRWATHGAPCKDNAHPHHDCTGKIVLIHNGVVENYYDLKKELSEKGHKFTSDTDSEIIAHLIEEYTKTMPSKKAFFKAVKQLQGSYAIAALIGDNNELYIARKNSPLIIGVGKGEMFCASDIPAMLKYTKTFIPLEEGDLAVLSENGYKIYNSNQEETERKSITVDWNLEMAEKGGYPHFMLKEINDQKHFLFESLSADVSGSLELLKKYENIDVVACGTSYHAGLVLQILLSKHLKKRAQSYIASEYTFTANPDKKTLVIAISQSGETADTMQALKFAKKNEAKIISLTNVIESSITRLSNEVIYLNAGPEIGVAATKTFTSQLAVAYKLIFPEKDLSEIPKIVEKMLEKEDEIKELANKIKEKQNIFFLGRGLSYPVASEGALKFKEISYLHAEAYPGGELKHGPLSLIEDGVPVIALAPKDESLSKIYGNIKEVKARGAFVITLTSDESVKRESEFSIDIPVMDEIFYPFAMIIPLQLLAYYVSTFRNINPDKPRNLAKSVTVE